MPPAGSNTIAIASPVSGATITRNRVILKGALDPNLKGMQIVVETSRPGETAPDSSYLAHINGVYFAAVVPLVDGTNIIKVKGTDQNGVERSATVTINASPGPDAVLLTYTTPNAGLPEANPDGSTSLDVTLQAINYTWDQVTYSWDFNGDGAGDLQCSTTSVTTGRYTSPGIYLPMVTMTGSLGRQYKDTTIVNVMNPDDMDGMFKMIWNSMKNALSNQDIARAMTHIADSSKESFAAQFDAVGGALAAAVAGMGNVNRVQMGTGFAEYEFRTQVNGNTYSFQVMFGQDTDGMWRISSF